MTKADIAKEVYEKTELSRNDAVHMVELIVEALKTALSDGETVKIAGFGTFIVRKTGARKGRNLKTGEEIPIAPRRVVTFKASQKFKSMVNGEGVM
jgi:integration host factor subunit alpha